VSETIVDPHADRSTSLTVKYGKDYDDPWVVFRGSPSAIREQALEYFGVTPDERQGQLDTHSLVIELVYLAQSSYHVATQAGGQTIPPKTDAVPADEKPSSEAAEIPEPSSPAGGDVWERAAAARKKPEPTLLERIEACETRVELQDLFVANQEALAPGTEAREAWKARGKALPA
jgi:hypothetical protein